MTPTERDQYVSDIAIELADACTRDEARNILGLAMRKVEDIHDSRAEAYWLAAQDPELIAQRETYTERQIAAARGDYGV